MNIKSMLRSFSSRNYRLYFIGQVISLTGTWMQRVAMGWLVYKMTEDPKWLGTMEFASLFTACLIAPFAGVISDRISRKNIFIFSQFIAMIQAIALGLLVMYSNPGIHLIILFCLILGLTNGLEFPTRQAFVVDLVEKKEDLDNAIALNSIMFNGSRLVGPVIAGYIIAASSEGMCFLINGISYIAVIIMLFMMKIEVKKKTENNKIMTDLKIGVLYAWNNSYIRTILFLLFMFSFCGLPVLSFLPVFAKDILNGDSKMLGLLMGGSGVGACIGAFYLIARKGVKGLEKITGLSCFLFGVSLILFCLSKNTYLSIFLMILVGYNLILVWVSSNTLLQFYVEEKYRGRIMSFFIMTFMGAMPLGSLLLGYLSTSYGLVNVLICGGVICILTSIIFKINMNEVCEEIESSHCEKV